MVCQVDISILCMLSSKLFFSTNRYELILYYMYPFEIGDLKLIKRRTKLIQHLMQNELICYRSLKFFSLAAWIFLSAKFRFLQHCHYYMSIKELIKFVLLALSDSLNFSPVSSMRYFAFPLPGILSRVVPYREYLISIKLNLFSVSHFSNFVTKDVKATLTKASDFSSRKAILRSISLNMSLCLYFTSFSKILSECLSLIVGWQSQHNLSL